MISMASRDTFGSFTAFIDASYIQGVFCWNYDAFHISFQANTSEVIDMVGVLQIFARHLPRDQRHPQPLKCKWLFPHCETRGWYRQLVPPPGLLAEI